LRRSVTLGVRAVVLDGEGRVLLVEHTYLHGWHLPGGGVERGENAEQAVERELREEGGVRLTAAPRLIGIETDHVAFPGDHVLLYRAQSWEACPSDSEGEILRTGWFSPAELPAGVTPKTVRRIAAALPAADAD
jgi:ADP-ribose pyrophosphatase YjhB (NUDIX family)